PRKVKIVERARVENERPIVTVAKHSTVTLLPTSVPRSFGELSASMEREFAGDASIGDGGDQGFDSVTVGDDVGPTVPVTEPVEAEIPSPKRSKKKRVIYDSEGLPVASHPPKRLRADYGNTGGSATGGKSLSALNRLLQTSRLSVEQGVPTLSTLPFITSSVTASPLEEGGDRTDSVTGAKSVDPEVDSLARSAAPVMTEATTIATVSTTFSILADVLAIGEVRMCAEYNILEKRKLRSRVEEKDILLEAKDKEIEDLKSQFLKAKEESTEVAQLRAQVSDLEAT
ncbi:hypothetical protein Tco_0068150, partial [Tanacetum coccineum]